MDIFWISRWNLVKTSWKPPGNPLETPWKPHGNPLETSWKPCGNPLETPRKPLGNLMETSWKYHGNLMEVAWKSHGNLLLVSWHFLRAFLTLSRPIETSSTLSISIASQSCNFMLVEWGFTLTSNLCDVLSTYIVVWVRVDLVDTVSWQDVGGDAG